jgi:hypothetical protein
MVKLTEAERAEIYAQALAATVPKAKRPEPATAAKEGQVLAGGWVEDTKPTVQVINDATTHNDALARRLRQDEAEAIRTRYQLELDRWWESTRNVFEDAYDYSTGFMERRHKTSCHRGPGDSDW